MATADRMARDAEAKRKKEEAEVAARNPWPAIDARQEALTPVALQPGQDFRSNDPVTNRKIDVNDTTREINRRLRENRYQDAATAADDASMPFQYKAESTWKDDPEAPVLRAKLEILERERANFGKPVPMEFIDQVALARSLAMKNGTLLSANDIDQYVDWERVNIAADKYVKLYMSGQVNASDNVLKTFFQKEPELAGLLGAAIQIKADEDSENSLLMEAAKNPTVVEDAFETAGGHFAKVLNAYFENVTGPMQNYLRASWYQAEQFVGLIPGESAFTAPSIGEALEITQDDKYNDAYLADMVEKTDYTYFEVEVAKTLHQARVQGKDDVETVQALYEKYGDDMDAVVVMHNMIEAASGNPYYTQLMAQVEAAWMGNTGSFLNPFSDPTITEYQEVYNSDILNSANKVLTFGSEIVFDPLIVGTAPLRAITAARYSLSRLAPGAKGGVGAIALKSQRWHPTNKTQRAFQRFVDDLNKIEDLTAQGNIGAAAEARRRFARQHGMYWSDDLIEQVSRLAPRTDGKLTVEGVVKFADNMNEEYLDTMTHYLDEAGDVGLAGSELAQSVQMVMDDLGVQSFDQAIAKAGRTSGQFRASRSPQAPKISALAAARMATSNFIGARLLPIHKQAELLAKYVDATDPVEFSAQFADNAGAIGDDVRAYKSDASLVGRPSGIWDSLGRVPNRVDISRGFDLTSASEATMLFNYARQFLPRHMAAQIRNAWTKGNVASRRNLLVGTVQAAMRSRGINVTRLQAAQIAGVVQRKVATGGKGTPGVDTYGIQVSDGLDLPSARLTTSERERVIETARAKADLADLQARAGVPQTDVLFEVDEFKPLGRDEYLYTLNGQEFVITGDQYRRFTKYLKKETEVIREPSRTDIELAEIDRVGGERVLSDPEHPRYEEAWAELDTAAAQAAWREGVLADPKRVERMIDEILGVYEPDEFAKDWHLEPMTEGVTRDRPTLPSELGAGASPAGARKADEDFIRDGTISQTDLRRIVDNWGEDLTSAWLWSGHLDNYLDDSLNLPVPPALRQGLGGEVIPGIKGLPAEWVEGLGVTTTRTGRKRKSKYDEKLDTEGLTQEQIDEALKLREKKRKQRNRPSTVTRIAVPFAQGGRKGRGARMASDEEAQYAHYRDQVEADLRSGELDDFIDEWLANENLGTREVAVSKRTPLKDEGIDPERTDSMPRNLGDRMDETQGRVASALHVDQTATFVRVPTIADMEFFRTYGDAAYQHMMYRTSRGLQKATDVWSFGTLAGWRFGMRNAVEENMFYFLSGGRLSDWVAGRRLTTTRGRAIPDSYSYDGWSFREKGNTETPEGRKQNMRYKQNVGVINRWVESARTWLWTKAGREGTLPDYLDDWADTAGIAGFMRRNVIGPALAPRLGIRGKGAFKGSLDNNRPFIDNEEWEAAVIAMARDKNPEPMYQLLLRASVAAKIGPVGLTDAERALFARLATGTAERGLVEEISGLARFMNSGDLPQYLDSVSGLDEVLTPGVTYGQMKERGVRGDTVGVANGFTTSTKLNKTFHQHWHHQLRWVMEGDGVVGEAAVTAIYRMARGEISVQEAKLLVRDLLGEMDDKSVWNTEMSNLSRPADLDSFAEDYFESVLALFQTRDDLINLDLLARFFDEDGVYLGWYKPRVRNPDMEDALSPSTFYDERITVNDLLRMDSEVKPPRMLVPRIPNTVPIATDVAGLIDASWKWMNRQNARLSKQNIFWANALRIHRETAAQRARLADIIQENSGVKKGTSIDEPEYVMSREEAERLAEEMSSKQIAEQAYEATMAYIDNPNVRSNLAWKSRNVSRYYRATEDFWRRSRRAAAQNPELFAKFALIYGLAEDSGFVFRDQYGDKQFMYPGNQFVLSSLGLLTGQGFLPQEMNPWSINGKVLGASPSLEPTSNVPGLTGFANGAAAAVFSYLPAGDGQTLGQKLPGLQSLVMGRFFQPTGNGVIDTINATLPAHARFFTDYMNAEQAETSLMSSYLQIVTWSYARGDLDELTVINPDGSITKRQFESYQDLKGTVEEEKMRALAHAAVTTKNVLRFLLPASPQLRMQDASNFGRSLGIPNLDAYENTHKEAIRTLDPKFLKILAEARGTDFLDPMDYAMDMWMAELADDWDKSEYLTGNYSLSPYGVSTFTSDGSVVANMAMVQPYEDVATWWRQPSNEKWLKNPAFRDAYSFFAPRSVDGEFSQSMWGTFRYVDKIKVKKTETQFIDALAANEYRYKLGSVTREAQGYIDGLDPFSPTYFDDKKFWEDWATDEKNRLQDEYEGVDAKNGWINRDGDAETAYAAMNEILSVMRREEGGYENDLAWKFQFVNDEWQTYQSQRLVYSSSSKDDVQKRKELERDFWLGLEDFMGPENPELDHYINAVIRRLDDIELRKGEE